MERIINLHEVDEVGNLFDIGNPIGDASSPKNVGDSTKLAAKILAHRR